MKNQRLGIYLDSEGVAGAVTQGKDLVSSAFLPYSLLDGQLSSEPIDFKIKTEALLKRVIEELNVDTNQLSLSFSDKKTIFRYLSLPAMTNKELQLALPLEVEKYIPFKIENVVWNYSKAAGSQRNKLRVAFLGVKRDAWEEIVDMVKNVNFKIKYMESGSFATLSTLIHLNKIPKREKDFVVFIISDYDGELTIFSDKFPYFSRHTKLPLTMEGKLDISKIGDELRLTLDYYRREFGNKRLSKILFLGSRKNLQDYQSISEKIELKIENLALEDLSNGNISTVQEFKAYCTALDNYREKSLTIDLLEEEAKKKKELAAELESRDGLAVKPSGEDVPWNIRPLIAVISIGLVFGGVVLLWQAQRNKPKGIQRTEGVKNISEILSQVSDNPKFKQGNFTIRDLDAKKTELEKEYNFFKGFDDIDRQTTPILAFVCESVTPGMWFDQLSFSRDNDLKDYALSIQGFIYLGDSQRESDSLNQFISYVKESEFLQKEEKKVELVFVRKKELSDYQVTEFKLNIE